MRRSGSRPLAICLLAAMATACSLDEPVQTTEAAERELAVLEADPLVRFQAPATTLVRSDGRPAGSQKTLFGRQQWATELWRDYSTTGTPGETVEAYLAPAAASGWKLLQVRCRREILRVTAVFAKELPVFTALPSVVLEVTAETEKRVLSVHASNQTPPEGDTPVSAGLPRRDLHCLRGFDPADPRRHPRSATPARTGPQLCALLSPGEVQRFAPEVAGSAPDVGLDDRPMCRFTDANGLPVGIQILDAAQTPRVRFEDRQYSLSHADRGFFLLAPETGSDRLQGAWVDTPTGALELDAAGVTLDEPTMVALGRALQRAGSGR